MKNPLSRRLLRELRQDIGKYIALFLFLMLTTGFISGFLVADGSMVRAYDESFEKYNIESGHFILEDKLPDETKAKLEAAGVSVYELFTRKQRSITKIPCAFSKTAARSIRPMCLMAACRRVRAR